MWGKHSYHKVILRSLIIRKLPYNKYITQQVCTLYIRTENSWAASVYKPTHLTRNLNRLYSFPWTSMRDGGTRFCTAPHLSQNPLLRLRFQSPLESFLSSPQAGMGTGTHSQLLRQSRFLSFRKSWGSGLLCGLFQSATAV